MKTYVDSWSKVMKELHDALDHAEEQGLPLSSVELNETEWEAFVHARTQLANGGTLPQSPSLRSGSVYYRGVRIYKEKT